MARTAVVVGAGVAGQTAAGALAARGVPVLLVEQEPVAGGRAGGYACKAATDSVLCGVCLSARALRALPLVRGVTLRVDTKVVGIQGAPGHFSVRLVRRERGVEVARCTACGLCADACPAGAISPPHPLAVPQAYVVDPDRCLRAHGEQCSLCEEVCPFDAVRLRTGPQEETIEAGAVVLATGFVPFPASRKGQFGYGRLPGVITTWDLERGLQQYGAAYLTRLAPDWRRVAFVHCVGSRDVAGGRGWCAQVCCATALRLAARLIHEVPDLHATMFFMDLQRCAPGIARLLRELPAAIHLVRGIPAEVREEPGGLAVTFEDLAIAARRQEQFDVVVLAIGMDGPPPVDGAPAGDGGFLGDLPSGVVRAGACGGPMSITDAIAEGLRAAGAALRVLENAS